ncbi:electron transport complex protein RnfG, partial [Pasteurella multocida subsp. multocida str. Anand1_buffalo]
ETRISDWILSFSQQQLRSDNLADWAVKKMVANLTSLRAPLSRHAL